MDHFGKTSLSGQLGAMVGVWPGGAGAPKGENWKKFVGLIQRGKL